jgi:hypothetical protein
MALSAKQRRALAKTSKSKRAALLRSFRGTGIGPRTNRRQAVALQANTQGVGCVPRRPFGAARLIRNPSLSCWSALSPDHLPLPRAVGPYLPVRATRVLRSDRAVNIFGAFRREGGQAGIGGDWNNVIALTSVDETQPINAAANAYLYTMPLAGFGAGTSALTLVPAAITLQVMNREALNSTTGIIYAGVMSTQADIRGRTETWSTYAARFIEFMAPRLMSAGKLCLKGVQVNSYPLSMSQLSEFTTLVNSTDAAVTYDSALPHLEGFAPIMVYNPDKVELEYLLTVEYRVRFDLANPASAAHRHFTVASDSTWDKLMRQAVALGHGVRDIADVVASTGQAIQGVRAALARPSVPMLVD